MSVARTGKRQHKADEFGALECANHLTANLRPHNEQSQRHQLGIAEVPNFFLQGDAGPHLVKVMTVPDDDGIDFHLLLFSNSFDCCHSDSSSSSETSCG